MADTEINVKTTEPADKPRTVVSRKHREERIPWQRLALSLLGIAILAGIWRWAVWHLYSLPGHSISAYTSITNNTVYTIATIVVFFISGKMLFDWKNQTTSTVVEQASHVFERKEAKKDIAITERVDVATVQKFAQQYKNDPSYRPLDTIQDLDVGDFR